MPQTQTFTGNDIATKASMLFFNIDKEKLKRCVEQADTYLYEKSLFSDPGEDYTKHTFLKDGVVLECFNIPGY